MCLNIKSKKFTPPSFCRQLLVNVIVICCLAVSFDVQAISLQEQRKLYDKAMQYIRAGNLKRYQEIQDRLRDYPLYPYLYYEWLKPRLNRANIEQVRWFFDNYDDMPDADKLRSKWLLMLARKSDWHTFLDFYTPQRDKRLQCLQLVARMKTDNQVYLLQDIRTLWLTGESLPDECDAPFKYLYDNQFLDSDDVWHRIRLAMENGKPALANYLAKKLPPEKKQLQEYWGKIHQNPARYTANLKLEDNPLSREIIVYGVERLARRNIGQALKRWELIRQNYSFSNTESAQLERYLAIRAARKDHDLAAELLDRVEPSLVDDEVFLYRLKTALAGPNWQQLLAWTEGFPAYPEIKNQWWYWRGRALEQTGNPAEARQAFQRIAGERDYYGFLAADKLGSEYRMNHYPLPENLKDKQLVQELPAIQRAGEFYQRGKYYPARREWHHALKRMTVVQLQMAAMIAKEWGWYDRAIFTLGRAKIYDDLVLRFPLLYRDKLDHYANKRDLDLGWMYGLVRAESAFVEDARSPAGALGLMQVMPATGRETAQRIGMKNFNKNRLLEADINIPIGSAYLKQMLDRFAGNRAMATAAYNAGPHRVRQWRPKNNCLAPDVWVELIPFSETRKYVKRVLSYASIYDWRLETKPVLLSQRMPAITAKGQSGQLDDPACSLTTVSMR